MPVRAICGWFGLRSPANILPDLDPPYIINPGERRKFLMRSSRVLQSSVVVVGLLLTGIVLQARGADPLAEVMASLPNRINPLAGETNPLPPLERLLGVDQQFWVKVGPPEASLSVSLVEPRVKSPAPRGTILVLHGVMDHSATMLPAARTMADAGYRAVLVDLRGQGRSTGKYMTFGVQEAKDLSQVIDAIERRGLLAGNLGVYGISYGATTSIHLAAADRRIRAVVAVEPFCTAREEVPHFARVVAPGVGSLISDKTYQHSLDEAGRIAQLRSRRGRRREGHPADLGPGAHHPRHERLDRAARTSERLHAAARITASWSRSPVWDTSRMARSRRVCRPRLRLV